MLKDSLSTTFPFKQNFISTNGHNLHYVDEGEGSPLVMVHGNPTWSFLYRDYIKALKSKYRVIALDHIGCGLSDKPPSANYSFSLKQRIADLQTLLDHLNLKEKITLMVHDWGGAIGMGYAVNNPEKIKGFIITNTSAFHKPAHIPLPWQLKIAKTKIGYYLLKKTPIFLQWALKVGLKKTTLTKQEKEGYLTPYQGDINNRLAISYFVKDIPLHSKDLSFDEISKIENNLSLFKDFPMLICWGEQDPTFNTLVLKEWEKRFPQAEAHAFKESGHYVLEDSKSEVLELIKNFLKKNQ